MANAFIGEIRMFAGTFAPQGWALCDGQLMPISENDALFNLIGTTYGGDGQSTFGLPNLQSRVPLHLGTNAGQSFALAEAGGVESVTLTVNQLPSHNHPLLAASAAQGGAVAVPAANTVLADEQLNPAPNPAPFAYLPFNNVTQVPLATNSIAASGGNQPHDNMQPFLTINFIISLFGIYPPPN
jgi:microcystin-dependent protein